MVGSTHNCKQFVIDIPCFWVPQKNVRSAQNVLKQMEDAGVKPDAVTYSYLIANSQREKDITKVVYDFCWFLITSIAIRYTLMENNHLLLDP